MQSENMLAELRSRLDKLPKVDRGFSWEMRDSRGNEFIRAYGDMASLFKWILDNTDALSAAIAVSPSPISADAVEPVAAYTVDLTGCEHLSRDVAGIERIAAAGANGQTQVIYLYDAPPASISADAVVEDGAKLIAAWIGYAWDGLGDRDISADHPDWCFNGIGARQMQGGKPALRKLAAAILALKGTFPAVDGWRTMDSAPKKDKLLLWNGREVYEGYWGTTSYNRKTKGYDFAWVRHPSSGDTKPTLWQPLPAAPSQESDHDNG